MYRKFFKRVLDIILSALALVTLSPVLLVIAILVRVKLGSPVIFCQERPGKDEKIFKLYKFRTMTDAWDEDNQLLPDELRLMPFGKTLRSTSLDELPELWNILKGDMSIVGPRPLLPQDVACMNEIQHCRHTVRPGLTGLAQCSGRNVLDWDTKLALDVTYINEYEFLYDCRILLRTVGKVLKQENVAFEDPAYDMSLKEWNEQKQKILN